MCAYSFSLPSVIAVSVISEANNEDRRSSWPPWFCGVSREHKWQQQQLWCCKHRTETGCIFLFLHVTSESKCVIRLFCGLPVIRAKCIKTNHRFPVSPKVREGGDRTAAAVAATLLLGERASHLLVAGKFETPMLTELSPDELFAAQTVFRVLLYLSFHRLILGSLESRQAGLVLTIS